jgi:hypothetical protein
MKAIPKPKNPNDLWCSGCEAYKFVVAQEVCGPIHAGAEEANRRLVFDGAWGAKRGAITPEWEHVCPTEVVTPQL